MREVLGPDFSQQMRPIPVRRRSHRQDQRPPDVSPAAVEELVRSIRLIASKLEIAVLPHVLLIIVTPMTCDLYQCDSSQ
ncbi:MAG: hypothetical protein ACLPID_15640 [Beijerinckiaceae bacterium]